MDHLLEIAQKFSIWWSGASYKDLPSHLHKRYVGLGCTMIAATFLSASSGYYAATYCLNSRLAGFIGGTVPALAIWGVDRAILCQSKPKKKLGRYVLSRFLLGGTISFAISIPITVQMFQGSTIKTAVNGLENKNNELANRIKEDTDEINNRTQEYNDRIQKAKDARFDYLKRENQIAIEDKKKLEKEKDSLLELLNKNIEEIKD